MNRESLLDLCDFSELNRTSTPLIMHCNYKILYLILLLIFTSNYSFSQIYIREPQTPKETYNLLSKGVSISKRGDYPGALEYFSICEVAAKKNGWSNELFLAQSQAAEAYQHMSNYGEALGYYMVALDTAENDTKLNKGIPAILNNIGNIYSYEKDYKGALEYYKKAYPIAKANKLDDLTVLIASNLADLYNNQGKYKEAREHLIEVKNMTMSDETEQLWQVNYAETLALEGKLEEAEKIALNLIDKVEKKRIGGCYVCITELLSHIYMHSDNIETAIFYAKRGLYQTDEVKKQIRLL